MHCIGIVKYFPTPFHIFFSLVVNILHDLNMASWQRRPHGVALFNSSKYCSSGILQAPEADNSYSYQQVRLHALHNHLWQDPWSAGLNFYFSALGAIHSAALDEVR